MIVSLFEDPFQFFNFFHKGHNAFWGHFPAFYSTSRRAVTLFVDIFQHFNFFPEGPKRFQGWNLEFPDFSRFFPHQISFLQPIWRCPWWFFSNQRIEMGKKHSFILHVPNLFSITNWVININRSYIFSNFHVLTRSGYRFFGSFSGYRGSFQT